MNRFARTSETKYLIGASAIALACVLLLTLPGCKIPCLRGAEDGRAMPESYNGRTDEENSAELSIEEFFQDGVLTGLIREGLAGNQELKILAEEVQIAGNDVLRRRGAIFPFFNLGGRAGLEKSSLFTRDGAVEENLQFEPGRNFPSPLPNFMVGADVSWQVDIWRQLRNARDAATLRYLATDEGRNYVVTRLVAEIAENYYTLRSLDERMKILDQTIAVQERSLEIARAAKEGARGTELPIQRFQAEVRKNQSEKLILQQEIVETENRINYLAGRFPQPVARQTDDFFRLNLPGMRLGFPCELLLNRPDVRQAERELEAAGLDVLVARANFYPKLTLTAGVGFEGFNPRYLVMTPESLFYNAVGDLVAPVLNRSAVKADYFDANARQLQAVYKYQQTVLQAFTEVVNRINGVENYTKSLEIKNQQLVALVASVENANRLFLATRIEYFDVLFAQRDLMEARMAVIETKRQQLEAYVNTYQALGGGLVQYDYSDTAVVTVEPLPPPSPADHTDTPLPVPPAPGADIPPVDTTPDTP